MQRNFNLKFREVSSSKIYDEIAVAEQEWLCALLLRAGISKLMINKALHDPEFSLAFWREYLFEKGYLIIIKNLYTKSIAVSKIDPDSGEKIKIGEWSKPDIIRYKEDRSKVKLEFKYWQII